MTMKLYPEEAIQDIADAIREKNGSEDTYTVSQMAEAIGDIETGGGGSDFGVEYNAHKAPNPLNLLYALEHGTAVTGEFKLTQTLPNTETLVIQTGLSDINMLYFVDVDMQTFTGWGGFTFEAIYNKYLDENDEPVIKAYGRRGNYDAITNNMVAYGSYRVDGGNLYMTAQYNHHSQYSPLVANHTIKWIAF